MHIMLLESQGDSFLQRGMLPDRIKRVLEVTNPKLLVQLSVAHFAAKMNKVVKREHFRKARKTRDYFVQLYTGKINFIPNTTPPVLKDYRKRLYQEAQDTAIQQYEKVERNFCVYN